MIEENLSKINETLDDHEKRLFKLEAILNKKEVSPILKSKKSLSDHLMDLRDKSGFSKPLTSDEVYEKIQGIYSCELNRVKVALIRLADRKELRKASKIVNGKKYKAYVW